MWVFREKNMFFYIVGAMVNLILTHCELTDSQLLQSSKMIKGLCKTRHKPTEEEIVGVAIGKFPDSKKLKCYMQCSLNIMKVMKGNVIDPDGARKQIDLMMPLKYRTPMKIQLDSCKDVNVSEDGCQVASRFVECCYKVNPKNPVIPF